MIRIEILYTYIVWEELNAPLLQPASSAFHPLTMTWQPPLLASFLLPTAPFHFQDLSWSLRRTFARCFQSTFYIGKDEAVSPPNRRYSILNLSLGTPLNQTYSIFFLCLLLCLIIKERHFPSFYPCFLGIFFCNLLGKLNFLLQVLFQLDKILSVGTNS